VIVDNAIRAALPDTCCMNVLSRPSTPMWIPTPIYEALPYAYVLGGVLFFTGTLYIGLTAPGAALYIACGLLSSVYGLFIFSRRRAYRSGLGKTGQFEPSRIPNPT
jgi:hypothetical protein